ncbi:LGFP repeat-containing protein [uncultured Amnibacterium sp.]|uniref:LGFP repeat-containing protein n=1 Tax=uncultured Amnibacterium sp. TaxID=1631851 RepID=UPI0035CCA1BB
MSARTRRRARLRGLLAVLAGLALVATGVGLTAATEQAAKAAVLDSFDPADIISNGVMYNSATMTAAQIQTFLNGKQPTCAAGATCLKSVKVDMPAMAANPMCRAVGGKQSQTAAQVIAAVAAACDVNPQVMLVMLQKEQTLVTGRTPYSGETVALIYRKATGLGCPDTAACDPSKYGLFNQLYGVAYWLVRYTMPAGTGAGTAYSSVYNWFPVGRAGGVLYHPNATCGARTITIQNKATASLYYYTPYQPNAASLAAGWGIGNSCSSYGNRNFYLYFTSWFGSTHYTVTGAIKTYWTKHKATYGDPVGNATAAPGGTYQRFEKGMLLTSSSGTFGVRLGSMLTKYTALGGPAGPLGFPRKEQAVRTGASAGTTQSFRSGTVYVSSAGTAAVLAPVAAKYASSGGELGSLGYPTGDAVTGSGGTVQAFTGGRITSAAGTTTTLTGSTLAMWLKRGAQTGTLGWPTSAIATVTSGGTKGTVQSFTTGAVTVRGGTTTSITGPIGLNYLSHAGPSGVLGWPSSVLIKSSAAGGGYVQRFTGGTVYFGATTGVHAIANGKALTLYNQRGGTTGSLGWLILSANDKHGIGGNSAVFQGGRIYSSKVGTVAVLGAILEKYLAKDGTGGTLGWPTSNAKNVKGVTVQTFQHGSISWTAEGGAKASSR